MAIKKNDVLLLLTELQDQGVDVKAQINSLMRSSEVPLEVLKFVNENRSLDIIEFYEHIRKTGNAKKSNLYKNIVREIEDPQEILTTLSSLLTNILLWSRGVDNKQLFLENARASEISAVLSNYFKTYDITLGMQLIKLIRTDLVSLEYVSGHRKAA